MDPEKKTVKFPVWDLETDEIIEMEMDEDSYNAMIAAEKEAEEHEKEIEKEQREEGWRILQCIRDDD